MLRGRQDLVTGGSGSGCGSLAHVSRDWWQIEDIDGDCEKEIIV